MKGLASLALVVLGAVSPACKTSERAWRISPLGAEATRDRINLWPFVYHAGGATSVLWPLFDVDDKGFALRPLIAKNESHYSILYPLASFDTATGTGWVVPFYSTGDNDGLFPLVNFGELSWAGPAWWKDDSAGVFPIARVGDGFSWVGPAWWTDQGRSWGLFPIAMLGGFNYVGPAWWSESGRSFGLFPIAGANLFGSGIDHIGPIWWDNDVNRGWTGGLFPLFSYADGGDELGLFPLYWHDKDEESQSTTFLLGLGHSSSSTEGSYQWLLPLYYHEDEGDRSDTAVLPLFWKSTRGERTDVYTPLGRRRVSPEGSSLDIYPLWWSSATADSTTRTLLPFFHYTQNGDERTLITPLGGRGWSRSGEVAFMNILGPVYHSSESTRRDESRVAFMWPLFQRHRKGTETTTHFAGLYSLTSSPDESSFQYAFGLGHGTRDASGSSHRFWPVYSWSDQAELPGFAYSMTLLGQHRSGETTKRRLFPFYWSESSPRESSWNALLGFVHHEKAMVDGIEDERWWAWPLAAYSNGARGGSFVADTSLVGGSKWEGGSRFQVGASLLYASTTESTRTSRRESDRYLVFLTHVEEELVGPHVPVVRRDDRENRIQRESTGFLFDAFVSTAETYRVWSDNTVNANEVSILRSAIRTEDLAPNQHAARDADAAHARAFLMRRGIGLTDEDPLTLAAAIGDFTAQNTDLVEHRHIRIPLLYGYERTGDAMDWYGPLGLVQYETDDAYSKFNLLYFLYRTETKGARTSRDIFPFVAWDSGPEELYVSFMWRLFHYQRDGNRSGGHILFIPWGDA